MLSLLCVFGVKFVVRILSLRARQNYEIPFVLLSIHASPQRFNADRTGGKPLFVAQLNQFIPLVVMTVLPYDATLKWPTAEELPDSDDTPVDNELQNSIPNLALDILCQIWASREDWFFGVDMGIYYPPDEPPLVPDGFLSLGVERFKDGKTCLSYVLWEEGGIVPILFLEVVSKTYGGEYDQKMKDYAELGVLYYAIYNPFCRPPGKRRGRKSRHAWHQPFELYKLVSGQYELQPGNPVWLPEVGLGLGSEVMTHHGWQREWVYWYNEAGQRYLTLSEVAEQERQRAEQERQRAEQERQRAEQEQGQRQQLVEQLKQLNLEQLRSLGIDPNLLK